MNRFNTLGTYTIHTVLTDNGVQFTNRSADHSAFHHIFERICDENGIEHRLTKVNHPWTNGQVERMNRTIKEATAVSLQFARATPVPPGRFHCGL